MLLFLKIIKRKDIFTSIYPEMYFFEKTYERKYRLWGHFSECPEYIWVDYKPLYSDNSPYILKYIEEGLKNGEIREKTNN